MTVSADELHRLWVIMGMDRKRARIEYKQICGRSPDDRDIDVEFEEAVRQDLSAASTVSVPLELALGLLLRPRGKGKGRSHPADERWKRRFKKLVVRRANLLWAELVDEYEKRTGKKAKQAPRLKRQAAETAHHDVGGHGLSVSTIFKRMSLRDGQLELRRNRS